MGGVGFNGNERVKTPCLDEMAVAGIRFNRFYAAAPLCSPTRGSCLTGRYPFRYGILAGHTGGMRVGEVTIAELLKKRGYVTGFFGKWHIGWVKPDEVGTRGFFSPPSQHGYDKYFATTSAVPTWNPTITPEDWNSWGESGDPWKGGFPYPRRNFTGADAQGRIGVGPRGDLLSLPELRVSQKQSLGEHYSFGRLQAAEVLRRRFCRALQFEQRHQRNTKPCGRVA